MKKMLTKKQKTILEDITTKVMRSFGKSIEDATENMIYKACALTVRDEIMKERKIKWGKRK